MRCPKCGLGDGDMIRAEYCGSVVTGRVVGMVSENQGARAGVYNVAGERAWPDGRRTDSGITLFCLCVATGWKKEKMNPQLELF